ncbi:MAG: 6-bladed beta-propeller [Acidimicrobiia bacterium]|nr:6-bladed beta-propeller [Acidimicrobiia bacterium]
MKTRIGIGIVIAAMGAMAADLASAPKLPHRLVENWAQLPAGWNFGECTGVEVDANDYVWVYNRGRHPVMQFDKNGKFLSAFEEAPVTSAHGLGIDPDGNVWLVDVKGHAVMKFNRAGRLQMVITNAGKQPGNNEAQYAFNEPTGIAFTPGGDFYVSDGYVNSRVIQFRKSGEYVRHWGKKGDQDGEFNLVHDVALDEQGRVYVADRTNERIQVFDAAGKFLQKWTHAGAPWGLAYAAKEKALYIADGKYNRVVKLNLEGQVLGTLGGFGKGPGQFDFAHHIAVDSEGSIYVVEIKNWRVQKFAYPR